MFASVKFRQICLSPFQKPEEYKVSDCQYTCSRWVLDYLFCKVESDLAGSIWRQERTRVEISGC